ILIADLSILFAHLCNLDSTSPAGIEPSTSVDKTWFDRKFNQFKTEDIRRQEQKTRLWMEVSHARQEAVHAHLSLLEAIASRTERNFGRSVIFQNDMDGGTRRWFARLGASIAANIRSWKREILLTSADGAPLKRKVAQALVAAADEK